MYLFVFVSPLKLFKKRLSDHFFCLYVWVYGCSLCMAIAGVPYVLRAVTGFGIWGVVRGYGVWSGDWGVARGYG